MDKNQARATLWNLLEKKIAAMRADFKNQAANHFHQCDGIIQLAFELGTVTHDERTKLHVWINNEYRFRIMKNRHDTASSDDAENNAIKAYYAVKPIFMITR